MGFSLEHLSSPFSAMFCVGSVKAKLVGGINFLHVESFSLLLPNVVLNRLL